MMKLTTWHPDTCGCEVDYEWDTELPVEERTHTIVASKNQCEHHIQHDIPTLHETIFEENTRKNVMMHHAAELHPEHFPKTLQPARKPSFVNGIWVKPEPVYNVEYGAFNWAYCKNRVLHVSVDGLNDHSKLQNLADEKFGKGKVNADPAHPLLARV